MKRRETVDYIGAPSWGCLTHPVLVDELGTSLGPSWPGGFLNPDPKVQL